MKKQFRLYAGDNIISLKKLPDNSIDSVVTDPPYGLSFMGKKWDYDVPSVELWKEVYRVLKPGGHLLSFGGTRTYHRMVVNIEDAGFEIRDQIMWLYGSGFPKSRNVGKDIEKINVGGLSNLKQVGTKKGIVATNHHELCTTDKPKGFSYKTASHTISHSEVASARTQTTGDIPVYEINNEYEGWGTAMKPAQEIVAVAQKPENLEGTGLNLIHIIKKELWKLYVKIVETSSELNQVEQKEGLDIALCLVEKNTNIQDALQGVMDMSQLRLMENMNWNIVLLWHDILEDLYQKMNRYTTSTKSNLIIDLKTLKSLEWQNILENITQVKDNQTDGLSVNALTAVVLFNALNLKLKDIHQHSVEDNVIYKEDKMDCQNEPICVARKPISEKSIAENVLKWGTGGINIDGCRVGTTDTYNYKNGPKGNSFSVGKGPDGKRNEPVEMNSEGRFPANIILECLCDEVIKGEKGEPFNYKGKEYNNKDTSMFNGDKPEAPSNYNDKGDIHTNPDCPCYMLDKQSGITNSGHWPKGKTKGFGEFGGGSSSYEGVGPKDNSKQGASRYFYNAKVSKKERNMGLDGIILQLSNLCVSFDYNNKKIELWESTEQKAKHQEVMELLTQKGIEEYKLRKVMENTICEWNTGLYGNKSTDLSQMVSTFTTLMVSNLITELKISNVLVEQNTNENILECILKMDFGGSIVASVMSGNPKNIIIEQKKDGCLDNVNVVELKPQLRISVKENKNIHSTIKPIQLMSYLVRLVTPENGIVLDPFMGSGSTGISTLLEGFRFCGMEMDEDYIKIAEARIENYEKYREFLKK